MSFGKDFTTLDYADLLLEAAGGIIAAAGFGWYYLHSPRRDPLRGSPLRLNTLSPAWVWLALLTYFLSQLAGLALASPYKAAGSGEDLRLWQSIIAGNIAHLILISAILGIAAHAFVTGLPMFGIGRRPFRHDLLGAMRFLLIGLCLCSAVAWATALVFHVFAPWFVTQPHAVFTTLSMGSTPRFVSLNAVVGAVLLAPIGEELLFRGILQTAFHRLFPARPHSLYHRWGAIVCVAVLFGTLHLATPQHVPALIVLGLLLGYLYERTGSLLAPIYVHILFNTKSVIWYYLGNP